MPKFYLKEEKLRQRHELIESLPSHELSIEFYAGQGYLTLLLYLGHFRRCVCIDKDPRALAYLLLMSPETPPKLFQMDNMVFIEKHLDRYLDFSLVDFDHYGCPNKTIMAFFDAIKGKVKHTFGLALTDGGLTSFMRGGKINLYRHYLVGEDKTIQWGPHKRDDIAEYLALSDNFIKTVAKRAGFDAECLSQITHHKPKHVLYAIYLVRPATPGCAGAS